MKRGDLVSVATQGEFGKPRPALIIQANQFLTHTSVTVLPVSSAVVDAPYLRVTIAPSMENGLLKTSQVMVDKAVTVLTEKLGAPFGKLDSDAMTEIDRHLALFLGIAK